MIKKLFLCAALLAPLAAQADYCKSIHGLAESIMQTRQNLVPITEAMDVAFNVDNEVVSELSKMMVKHAYSKSSYRSDDNKQRETAEFANYYYLLCLEAQE